MESFGKDWKNAYFWSDFQKEALWPTIKLFRNLFGSSSYQARRIKKSGLEFFIDIVLGEMVKIKIFEKKSRFSNTIEKVAAIQNRAIQIDHFVSLCGSRSNTRSGTRSDAFKYDYELAMKLP